MVCRDLGYWFILKHSIKYRNTNKFITGNFPSPTEVNYWNTVNFQSKYGNTERKRSDTVVTDKKRVQYRSMEKFNLHFYAKLIEFSVKYIFVIKKLVYI